MLREPLHWNDIAGGSLPRWPPGMISQFLRNVLTFLIFRMISATLSNYSATLSKCTFAREKRWERGRSLGDYAASSDEREEQRVFPEVNSGSKICVCENRRIEGCDCQAGLLDWMCGGNNSGRCHSSAGFLGDHPFLPPLNFDAATLPPHFILIDSQQLVHAALREHYTPVQSLTRSGDGALVARATITIAPALLGQERGEKIVTPNALIPSSRLQPNISSVDICSLKSAPLLSVLLTEIGQHERRQLWRAKKCGDIGQSGSQTCDYKTVSKITTQALDLGVLDTATAKAPKFQGLTFERLSICLLSTDGEDLVADWPSTPAIGGSIPGAVVENIYIYSPGVISRNYRKPKSGWPDRDLNPGPPECVSKALPLRLLARYLAFGRELLQLIILIQQSTFCIAYTPLVTAVAALH
ncbi:hypothetical protein PR048_006543 [Dryococelus australis]|uniref:Uncharacterized protein n=1 Tax=Dryococelus australis TaxID=614101 RepID=A0ABQ9IB96_9NEOP|nr:hypothetical protein PR048_006543 [Dryococelus australis]